MTFILVWIGDVSRLRRDPASVIQTRKVCVFKSLNRTVL